MRCFKWLLLVLVALLAVGWGFRNTVLKGQLEKALARQTGFGLELDRVNLGWNLTSFEIEGARLRNPPDFPDAEALNIKQVRVVVAPWSVFSREIHFREVILDVDKLVMVRKADRESNVDRLGGKSKPSGGGTPEPQAEPAPAPEPGTQKEKEPRGFRIDRLVLRLGQVEMRDYSKPGEGGGPAVTAMTLNAEQEHHDVTSLSQLGGLVLGGAVQQMGLFMLGQELQDSDSKLNKKIKKASDRLQKNLDRLFGKPQE